jgi:hypothetical protein
VHDLLPTLQALESELHHPGVSCTLQRLEQLLHPDFWEVGRSGRRYSRETVIGYLAAQNLQPDVTASDYAVRELANGLALLTYRSTHRQSQGGAVSGALRSSIWCWTQSGWQLLYHQGTPEAAAGAT